MRFDLSNGNDSNAHFNSAFDLGTVRQKATRKPKPINTYSMRERKAKGKHSLAKLQSDKRQFFECLLVKRPSVKRPFTDLPLSKRLSTRRQKVCRQNILYTLRWLGKTQGKYHLVTKSMNRYKISCYFHREIIPHLFFPYFLMWYVRERQKWIE